jgi:hypothetical protein
MELIVTRNPILLPVHYYMKSWSTSGCPKVFIQQKQQRYLSNKSIGKVNQKPALPLILKAPQNDQTDS